ncbi:MAG TPA: universal stress protein [Marmoricola sp.]|nr:universal stress protein [Marmoricola sp.]
MAEPENPYTVVVGVSATSKSPTALVWARAQAQANGGRLVAVRVYQDPKVSQAPPGTSGRTPPDVEQVRAAQRVRLQRDVDEVLGEDNGVETRVVRASKRRGLLEQALEADLLVIDAPRKPSMSPLLAQRIIYAATCPVVVMPPSISGAPESALSRSARTVGRAALRSAGTAGRPGYRPPMNPAD